MHQTPTDSFQAGYRLGIFAKSALAAAREAIASRTQGSSPLEEDYDVYDSPAMVRKGVDLATWQAKNLTSIPEIIPADFSAEIIPADWHEDAAGRPLSTLGPRSSLDALI